MGRAKEARAIGNSFFHNIIRLTICAYRLSDLALVIKFQRDSYSKVACKEENNTKTFLVEKTNIRVVLHRDKSFKCLHLSV